MNRLLNCARCGGDHEAISYEKLHNPITDGDGTVWDWWAACPTNGQPILMREEVKHDTPVEFFRDDAGALMLYRYSETPYDETPAAQNEHLVCVKGIVRTEQQGVMFSVPVTRGLVEYWAGLEAWLEVEARACAVRFPQTRQFGSTLDQRVFPVRGGRGVTDRIFAGEQIGQDRLER